MLFRKRERLAVQRNYILRQLIFIRYRFNRCLRNHRIFIVSKVRFNRCRCKFFCQLHKDFRSDCLTCKRSSFFHSPVNRIQKIILLHKRDPLVFAHFRRCLQIFQNVLLSGNFSRCIYNRHKVAGFFQRIYIAVKICLQLFGNRHRRDRFFRSYGFGFLNRLCRTHGFRQRFFGRRNSFTVYHIINGNCSLIRIDCYSIDALVLLCIRCVCKRDRLSELSHGVHRLFVFRKFIFEISKRHAAGLEIVDLTDLVIKRHINVSDLVRMQSMFNNCNLRSFTRFCIIYMMQSC